MVKNTQTAEVVNFDVLTDAWSLYFSASVPPLPQSSVPPLKQGETYNFSFK